MINQIGLPNITKWTEKKSMKYIYELRDRTDLICYLYYRNEFTGKFIYDGECMGYGLPYGTQYSSPEKIVDADVELNKNYTGYTAINKPLSEPNGLFPSNSTSATWVTRVGKDGKTFVDYCEPNVVITPVKKDKRMCETWSIPDNY